MPKQNGQLLAFNRGIQSRLGLARIDLERTALAAEVQTNWMPRTLGSMMLRPGWEYIDGTRSGAVAKLFPFVFATDDFAQLEVTSGTLRVRVDDELISRPSVTAAVTNGTFTSDLTGWTDSDESGGVSQWQVGGYMALMGTGTNAAIRDQQVTVSEAGTEHALRIIVARGPVILRVGSTSGGDDHITETTLGTGTHSLAFTPTGNFHIRLFSRRAFTSLVDSVAVEGAGTMELTVPWQEADRRIIRMTQSGDVLFVACDGYQQRKIERRATRSWSVVLYESETGPFRNVNTTPITITPSGLTGDITLTASSALFRSANVGSLYRIQSTGQTVTASINAQDTFTNPIRVAGVEGQRSFGISIAGTFTATVTLQYSVGEPGSWVDVQSYTAAESTSYNDDLDNQIIYYRIGVKSGDFSSGPVAVTLSYTSGSITGIARVTAYSGPTILSAIVLQDFGATTASSDWWESIWSDRRGWPSATALYEGRLWWFGKDKSIGSISDAFEDFDDNFEGDAGPISRSIGEGPVDAICWALPMQRLLIGTGGAEFSARSSSFDEPLTPSNFNIKPASTLGSALINAARIDSTGVFVDKSLQRLYQLSYNIDQNDYRPQDLTLLVPDLHEAGIVDIAIQRQPDTRIHCLRADGTVGVVVRDSAENVICWIELETDGEVEDACVLPGANEDRVYYIVNRSTGRFVEKWALESECRGRPTGKLADSFVYYSGSATTAIGGLGHLEGQEVVCWGWNTVTPFTDDDGNAVGKDFGTFTVVGAQITGLSDAVTDACVGLSYEARFKSAKQAFGAALGTPLNQRKRIDHVGMILMNTHKGGVQFGPDFETMDDMPAYENELEVGEDHVWEDYDKDMISFPGEWSTDSRLCLKAAAPRPCTVLAVTTAMVTHDKT
jgi:hypothetical protein